MQQRANIYDVTERVRRVLTKMNVNRCCSGIVVLMCMRWQWRQKISSLHQITHHKMNVLMNLFWAISSDTQKERCIVRNRMANFFSKQQWTYMSMKSHQMILLPHLHFMWKMINDSIDKIFNLLICKWIDHSFFFSGHFDFLIE